MTANLTPVERLTRTVTRGSEAWREDLIDLAEWAGSQDALRRLGLPSEWEQGSWISSRPGVAVQGHCGTAACMAGRYVLLRGWKPVRHDYSWGAELDGDYVQHPLIDGGESRSVEHLAPELLDITDTEANALFDGHNDLDDVLRVIGELLDGREVTHRDNR